MNDLPVPPYFIEIYERLPRQGPGSSECMERALAATGVAQQVRSVLDVGCGTGTQTLELARKTQAQIVGIDLVPGFVEKLRDRAESEGLGERVVARVADMTRLEDEFEPAAFDLIWSEGAIYFLGFSAGLRKLREFLQPGGHLLVTEATWLSDEPAEECRRFWEEEYPSMGSVEANLQVVEAEGFDLVEHFVLPRAAWMADFYTPLKAIVSEERARSDLSSSQGEVLDMFESEIRLFERFGDSFGYVFYVMRRRN